METLEGNTYLHVENHGKLHILYGGTKVVQHSPPPKTSPGLKGKQEEKEYLEIINYLCPYIYMYMVLMLLNQNVHLLFVLLMLQPQTMGASRMCYAIASTLRRASSCAPSCTASSGSPLTTWRRSCSSSFSSSLPLLQHPMCGSEVGPLYFLPRLQCIKQLIIHNNVNISYIGA